MNPEMALVGAVLQGVPAGDINISPGDFESPVLGELWAVIQRQTAAGTPVDPVTLVDHIGGVRGLTPLTMSDCISECPAPANATWYAQQVADASTRRGLRDIGIRAQQIAQESDRPAGDLIEDIRTGIDNLPHRRVAGARTVADMMPGLIDQLEHGIAHGTPTPWVDLDQLVRGWQRGRLYVVGARPGVGKSILGVDAALRTAREGQTVLMASVEMPEQELGMRMLANLSRISLSTLTADHKSEHDWERIGAASQKLASLPIEIDDSSQQSIATIRQRCRDIQRRGTLGLVVVDYLQLLTPTSTKIPRHEQVAEMSRQLKVLAREMDVPVIAMAQLSRAGSQRTEQKPLLTDLRESGSIEADADVVLLLHRDDGAEASAEVLVIVGKNRGGPRGEFPLAFYGHQSRLADISTNH